MTQFFKSRKSGVLALHAVNGETRLMVIPQQDDQVKGQITLGDKDFYPEMYEEGKETISENEFLAAAGEITGKIKNFLDKLRECE